MTAPVICFGQQPCGIFPRRFLYAKFVTARRLQAEIGGRIVFFYHDSDHDPRETQMIVRHRKTDEALTLNFAFENKVQRKYSPLHLKRIPAGWRDNAARQLPAFAPPCWVEAFKQVAATNVADFCLEMYRRMGLLDGIEVVRSSDPAVRRAACAIDDFFVDVPHAGETVRARCIGGALQLHEGGDSMLTLPACTYDQAQVSPTRDSRLRWMQSVLHCTHYIAGMGEQAYLKKEDAPDILFVNRDPIDRSDEAYTDAPAESAWLLAFGAHPDDIEFGCGGVVARETQAGRTAHVVVCSRGESATHGTPAERTAEAEAGAARLGASLEFADLGGDAHMEHRLATVLAFAALIRRHRPAVLLAPTTSVNQHPDHAVVGALVRDAARLARYGGVAELTARPAHAVSLLLYYAVTPEGEPPGQVPLLVDVSPPPVVAAWTASMQAHASQQRTRNYVELHLARARVLGLRAGVEHAMALYPNDPLVVGSLGELGPGARRF